MAITFVKADKVILIDGGDTEVTIQNLINAIRDWEDEQMAMDISHVANASGKQDLGGGILVGITLELLDNWRVQFEDRLGPDTIACKITGGNLVTTNIYDDNPVKPSTYTQVTITASSSATISESSAIQFASFNDKVTIDITTAYDGTVWPVGTGEQPVNNIIDAQSIATTRGFKKLYIIGNMIMSSSYNVSGYTLSGQSPSDSTIEIEAGCTTTGSIFEDMTVTGSFSGRGNWNRLHIDNVSGLDGSIHDSLFEASASIAESGSLDVIDCWSGRAGQQTPHLHGSGYTTLLMRNYSGGMHIDGITGGEQSIDMLSGNVTLDSGNTGGSFIIRGVAKFIDSSSAGMVVDQTDLLNKVNIASAMLDTSLVGYSTANTVATTFQSQEYGDEISINVVNGSSGSSFPIGTHTFPVNNLTQAKIMLDALEYKNLHIQDDFTFGAGDSLSGISIRGEGKQKTVITCVAGSILAYCEIYDAKVTGNLTGVIGYSNCHVSNLGSVGLVSSSVVSVIENCLIDGTITLPNNYTGTLFVLDSWSLSNESTPLILETNGGNFDLHMRNWSGFIDIRGVTSPDADYQIFLTSGGITLDSSVTSGSFKITGTGTLQDSSTNTTIDTTALVNDKETKGLKYLIETQRPHHTGFGNIWYWSPYDGNDSNTGDHPSSPTKTFSRAQSLAQTSNHDMIMCMTNDPSGLTTTDEEITISKNYLFVRGPGRDFRFKTTNPSVTITGEGVELSSVLIEASSSNAQNLIHVNGGNFAFLNDLWITGSNAEAVLLQNTDNTRINNTKIIQPASHGILFSGSCSHIRIEGSLIDDAGGHGIYMTGSLVYDPIVTHTTIHGSVGYGLYIGATTDDAIIHVDNIFAGNDSGSIFDLGEKSIIQSHADDVWAHDSGSKVRKDTGLIPAIV